MKYVRLQNNIVKEIIPAYAAPPEKWYGADFAAQCVEAPDDVAQGMVYDPAARTFSVIPTPDPQPLSDPIADHDVMIAELTQRIVNLEMK